MAVSDYQNLITSEHKTKPNFMAWLGVNLSFINDAINVMNTIVPAFDLDKAVGVQLDTLGLMTGVNRLLIFQPSDGSSPLLDDTTFRILQKSKIVRNQWDGTIETIQALWNIAFPLYHLIIKDYENMSIATIAIGSLTTLQQQLITNGYIIPKPMGVSMNYDFSSTSVFSYDLNDGTVYGGYDVGSWLATL
jgi:hypothetical protein